MRGYLEKKKCFHLDYRESERKLEGHENRRSFGKLVMLSTCAELTIKYKRICA